MPGVPVLRCLSLLQFLRAWRCWLSSRRLLILETTDSLPASRGEALSPRTAAALAGQPRAVIALHEAVTVQHKKIMQQKYELEREKSRATVAVRNANAQKQELSKLRESLSTPGSALQPRRTFSSSASPSPSPSSSASSRAATRRLNPTTSRTQTDTSAQSSLRKSSSSSRFPVAASVGYDASGSGRNPGSGRGIHGANPSSFGLTLGRSRAGIEEKPATHHDGEPLLSEGVPPSSSPYATPHRRSSPTTGVPFTPQFTSRALVDATRSLVELDAEQTVAAELSEMAKLRAQAAQWKRAGSDHGDGDHADNAAGTVTGIDRNS